MLYIIPIFMLVSCSISYSFKGGKIDENIKTVKITDFLNQAQLVYPSLTQAFNRELRSRMIEQTSLKETSNNADLEFEGEITDYRVDGTAVREDGYASMAKLTVTIKVRYTNNVKPEDSIDQSFSSFEEFSATRTLDEVQDGLITKIVANLVDMIYNETVGNW
ncbi:MAG: LPS assembly lipoprotein LptE [Dysgonamonadaceae bacterium]|nr:LPS assembly lipoprotein LptE [Dysgonamonadaceae bacterium]